MLIKTDIFCGSRMRAARCVNDFSLDDLEAATNMDKKKLWCFEVGKSIPTKNEEKVKRIKKIVIQALKEKKKNDKA